MKNPDSTRYLLFLVMSLMILGAMPVALADNRVALTVADQAVRIIRGVTVLKGAAGVALQKNDIVETGGGAAQIEFADELLVAIAPDTRILLVNPQFGENNPPEIVLLSGWLKVAHKGALAENRVLITSPLMRVSLAKGSSVLRASADKAEIFAESGVQAIAEISETIVVGDETKLALEQYALRLGGQALKISPRPPKPFIADMPMTFRDPLIKAPDRTKGVTIQPVAEREVNYLDIKHWLTGNIAAQKSFVKRFKPRLKDVNFRSQLDAELGQTVDWKPILHPPPPKPKIIKY